MYSKINILLIILAISFMCSCGPGRHIPSGSSVRDSVVVHIRDSVVYRDSLIPVPIPQESTSERIPDSDTSRLATSVAESEAWISDGQLHHTLRNRRDTMLIPILIPEHFHAQATTQRKAEVLHHTVYVEKELNWWQKFRMDMGTIALIAAAIIILVWTVKKFVLKI